MASPAQPPWTQAKMAADLRAEGFAVDIYDANLDFYLTCLLNPRRLAVLLNRILLPNESERLFQKRGPAFPGAKSLRSRITKKPSEWSQKIATLEQSLSVLKSEHFFQPESVVKALKKIDDLMGMTSLAAYPSRFKWGSYANQSVRGWPDADQFIKDEVKNPFLAFFREKLSCIQKDLEGALVILSISSANQLLSGLTFVHLIKTHHERLQIALHADLQLFEGTNGLVGELDSILNRNASKNQIKALWPDFQGLPLQDYLAPFLILPIRLPANQTLICPEAFCKFLVAQKEQHQAKGFIIETSRFKPDFFRRLGNELDAENLSFGFGLKTEMSAAVDSDPFAEACRAGVRIVQWQNLPADFKPVIRSLRNASKAGIWNHVEIPIEAQNKSNQNLMRFVASNPNIAHSWHPRPSPGEPFQQHVFPLAQRIQAYANVVRLPGQAFWSALQDTLYLFLYLMQNDLKQLRHRRIGADGYGLFNLGDNITYHYAKPQALPPGYLDEICRMVEAGGSVGTEWVRYNLERAFLIAYAMEQGVIVGNSSLKHPRPEYVAAVSRQTGLDLNEYLERGYTSVRPEYRGMGIGTRLLKGLTARVGAKKLFSVIGADNKGAQKMALRNNTKLVTTFYSQRAGKELGVWIPAHMLDSVHP